MTPQRPYMLRAIYQWLVDNGETPYVLVDASVEGVRVPADVIKDDQVVLNISPSAVQCLELGLDNVAFSCRFSGREHDIDLPIRSICAIYSKESGKGLEFEPGEYSAEEGVAGPKKARPKLELV